MVFRDILTGWPGSVHDSRVLRNSSLFATAAAKFPGDTHLLGDGGYPLKRLISPLKYIFKKQFIQQKLRTYLSPGLIFLQGTFIGAYFGGELVFQEGTCC